MTTALSPRPWRVPRAPKQSVFIHHFFGPPQFSYQYHEEFELVLVRSSSGKRIVGNAIGIYENHDLVLVPPQMPHGWSMELEPGIRADTEVVVALFTRESLGLSLLAMPEMRRVSQLLAEAERALAFGPRALAVVESRLIALAQADPGQAFLTLLTCLHDLAVVDDHEPVVGPMYARTSNETDFQAFSELVIFIHKEFHRPITLAEAAARLGLSLPVFTRFFRRMAGTSFIDYLNRWRIQHAATLLRQSKRPIMEVALASGFQNLSLFNRLFRRYQSLTPRQHRNLGGSS